MKGKYLLITLIFLIQSCSKQNKLFVLLKSDKTGIGFNNKITETDDFNILTDEYIFNGGGVALADFNRDGLPDLFFTGNMVSNELYLNKGHLKFENVTNSSKLNSTGFWSTGAAVVDINSDGWMDIYVSGAMNTNNRKNLRATPSCFRPEGAVTMVRCQGEGAGKRETYQVTLSEMKSIMIFFQPIFFTIISYNSSITISFVII